MDTANTLPATETMAAAPKTTTKREAWTPEQKAEKMKWVALLRQTGRTYVYISEKIGVPLPTLRRWLREPEGLAIDLSIATDTLDALVEKHNIQLSLRLKELMDQWVLVDTVLRANGDVLSLEYSRGFRLRCRIEQQVDRLSGGQWFGPRLKGSQQAAVEAALETVPQSGQVLPDIYGYCMAQQQVDAAYDAETGNTAAEMGAEKVSSAEAGHAKVSPEDETQAVTKPNSQAAQQRTPWPPDRDEKVSPKVSPGAGAYAGGPEGYDEDAENYTDVPLSEADEREWAESMAWRRASA